MLAASGFTSGGVDPIVFLYSYTEMAASHSLNLPLYCIEAQESWFGLGQRHPVL